MSLGVGIIGCGNISAAYLRLAPLFAGFEFRACADLNEKAAASRADEFGLRAESVAGLLAAKDIDLIVNLTIPAAHFEVGHQILAAGKHLYSEKPYVLSTQEGQSLAALAETKGLRIGSAPDTFLGGAHQFARHLIDAGQVGRISSGTCFVQSPGMEMWHPNPDFFFKPGGGPILDLGPYYIANLVNLLGPVRAVVALSSRAAATRTITSEPRYGQTIEVETPTTIHALLDFENGAQIIFAASWDVWQHGHAPMELYGSQGSIFIPDPNFFGGEVRVTAREAFVNAGPDWPHPFSVANEADGANYRGAGLADMALAIHEGRPHRCNQALALHVVEVMTAILQSGERRALVEIESRCARPEPLGPDQAAALLA